MSSTLGWKVHIDHCSKHSIVIDPRTLRLNSDKAIMNQVLYTTAVHSANAAHDGDSKNLKDIFKCSDIIEYENNGWCRFESVYKIDYNKIALYNDASWSDSGDPFTIIFEIGSDGGVKFIEMDDLAFAEDDGILGEIGFKAYLKRNFLNKRYEITFYDVRLNKDVYSYQCSSDNYKFYPVSKNQILVQYESQFLLFTVDEEERTVDKIDISYLFFNDINNINDINDINKWSMKLINGVSWFDKVCVLVCESRQLGASDVGYQTIFILDLHTLKILDIHRLNLIDQYYIKFKIISPNELLIWMQGRKTKTRLKINRLKSQTFNIFHLQNEKYIQKIDKLMIELHNDHTVYIENYTQRFEKFKSVLYSILDHVIYCKDIHGLIYQYLPIHYILKHSKNL